MKEDLLRARSYNTLRMVYSKTFEKLMIILQFIFHLMYELELDLKRRIFLILSWYGNE